MSFGKFQSNLFYSNPIQLLSNGFIFDYGIFSDPEHRFELAIQLGNLKTAYELATEAGSEQVNLSNPFGF